MHLPFIVPLRRVHPLARLLCRGNVVALIPGADGRLEIACRDGRQAIVEIGAETVVLPWLVVLRYRLDGRRSSLVVPKAATDPAAHRRLRVWLVWRAQIGDASRAVV